MPQRHQRFAGAPAFHPLAAGLIFLGAILRLFRWLHWRSLWLDEIYLAKSIVSRNWLDLLGKPLLDWQAAPPLFLLLERACVRMFGPGERSLRLVSLVFGVMSVGLMWAVARRLLRPGAATVALAIFSVCGPLIYYSSEVKPYGCDVACSLAIAWAVLRLMESHSMARSATAAAIGAVSIFLSYPSVFVLAAAALLLRRGTVALVWGAAFVVQYVVFIRPITHGSFHPYLVQYWLARDAFMPLWFTAPHWIFAKLWSVANATGGMDLAYPDAALLAWIIGAAMLRSRRDWLLLTGPLAFVLAASSLRLYPFDDRLALFVVPQLIVLAALGIAALWTNFPARCAAGALAVMLLLPSGTSAVKSLFHAPDREESLQLYGWMAPRWRPGDVIYLTHFAEPSFRYYQSQVAWPPEATAASNVRVQPASVDADAILQNVRSLAGAPRVWVVLIHATGGTFDVRNSTLAAFDASGHAIDQHIEPGAAVFLYDCSKF